jgi:DNA-binding transcriptional LysR family regulator
LELYQLRSFATVAELGHLTRAAERLHVSQPALSAQIKALEDELGVALVERGPAGMALTGAGRDLLSDALEVLAAAKRLRGRALAMHGELRARLRLGTVADPQLTRVADVLRRTVDRYPLLEVDVHQTISGAAFGLVRDGALDASFYFGNASHASVVAMPLRPLAFRIAIPAAWASRLAGASWDTLAAEPWIMTPTVSTHHALASELFAAHGIAPLRRVEADHEGIVSSLVAAGLGIALLREDLVEHAGGAVAIHGDTRIVTPLAFVHRRERDDDPAIRALREIVAEVWNVESHAESNAVNHSGSHA